MPQLNLTDQEFAELKHAVETHNDMHIDMELDDIQSIDLYPRGDSITTINAAQGTALRKELRAKMTKLGVIRSLMAKVGAKVHDSGYSK